MGHGCATELFSLHGLRPGSDGSRDTSSAPRPLKLLRWTPHSCCDPPPGRVDPERRLQREGYGTAAWGLVGGSG